MNLETLVRLVAEIAEREMRIARMRVGIVVTDIVNAEEVRNAARLVNGTFRLATQEEGACFDAIFVDRIPASDLAKLALGICDDALTRCLGQAVLSGGRIFVLKDACPIGPDTPAAFAEMLRRYRAALVSYGYVFLDEAAARPAAADAGEARPVFCGNVMSRRELLAYARGGCVAVAENVLVTDLARETARDMRIEIARHRAAAIAPERM